VIKKLYTIGDSWTYGWDLPGSNDYKVHKKDAWPTLLAREFNCELINEAWGGAPNDWMFRKTIEWASCQENLDDTILMVGWSEPNRREEIFKFYNTSHIEFDDIEKFIYTKLYNNELSHYKSICYMVTLQEFLKSKNIKYLFFQPWYDLLGSEKHLIEQRKQKDKFNKWVVKDDYQQQCYSENLEIGKIIKNIDVKYLIGPKVPNIPRSGLPTKHPNKKEHKIMAKFIKEKLIELYS
jgi:hypothetical protein